MKQIQNIHPTSHFSRSRSATIGILSLLIIPALLITFSHDAEAATGIKNAMDSLQTIAGKSGIGIDITGNPQQRISVVVGNIVQVVLSVLGIVFLALTVYGGWLWMTAAGNQERVDRAKNLLRDSIIGLIIIIAAYSITAFVIEGILKTAS